MAITITDLTIGGVAMPAPALKGVTEAENKIWSANTGRDDSGTMQGTLVAVKHTLDVKWPPLTYAQFKRIRDAVNQQWFTVAYTGADGVAKSWQGYAGDLKGTQYSWTDGAQYVQDVQVSLIER